MTKVCARKYEGMGVDRKKAVERCQRLVFSGLDEKKDMKTPHGNFTEIKDVVFQTMGSGFFKAEKWRKWGPGWW